MLKLLEKKMQKRRQFLSILNQDHLHGRELTDSRFVVAQNIHILYLDMANYRLHLYDNADHTSNR